MQETLLQQGKIPGKKNWGKEPDTEKGLLHTEINGKVIREFIQSEQGNYGEYYEAVFESIRNEKPVPVTAEQGLNVIRIIEAAFRSNEVKKVIEI